jgi:hypothetical protein
VTYTTAQARERLLETVASAVERLGVALANLGEAYEQLDDYTAERLEEQLFRPLQAAYGRATRGHGEFAGRHGLPRRSFEPEHLRARTTTAKENIASAVEAAGEADGILATLQDSMLPVEVGDAQLRADLAQVRQLLGSLRGRSRELVRTLGR